MGVLLKALWKMRIMLMGDTYIWRGTVDGNSAEIARGSLEDQKRDRMHWE
jgi:hypothetical protein